MFKILIDNYRLLSRFKRNILNAKIEEVFPDLAEFGEGDYGALAVEKPVIMLAMTARTGSSHLCSAISSTLNVGEPTELFNTRGTVQFELSKRNITSFGDYIRSICSDSDSFFIFKTNWIDFEYFSDKIKMIFPKLHVVYLNRMDVEAQAVSLYKAKVSGKWHDSKTINNNHVTITEEELRSKFDLKAICNCIDELELEKRFWERYFFKENIHPARVNYEDFDKDVVCAVNYIMNHFGIPVTEMESVKSNFKRLSDSINEEWLWKVKNYRNGNFFMKMKKQGLF